MKIQNIIDSMKLRKGVAMLAAFVTLSSSCLVCTSCEDMFTAENQLVTTNLAPQDTVYQVMGIVKRMQKLADRTVLLGEVRADLVKVNPTVASSDVQQLSNNDISVDNVYNSPREYYDVINSCNVYLAGVDSLQKSHGKYVYEREICAVKCFRAWCYLELAKIYGSVPFVTEPVLTADAAEQITSSGQKADMDQILTFCIDDLIGYAYKDYNNGLRPKYGNVTFWGYSFDNFFIPVRALLGELYLWKGSLNDNYDDYINAIRMYHDYFCFTNEERGTRNYVANWYDRYGNSYTSSFTNIFAGVENDHVVQEIAGMLPCDTVSYYGNTTDLRMIFNSQYSNNYYPWVTVSQRMKDISAGQDYCYYDFQSATQKDTVYMSKDPNYYSDWGTNTGLYVGDMRLRAVYRISSNETEKKYNGNVNDVQEYIVKWTEGSTRLSTDRKQAFVPYYRYGILYLHMAEALNRAGFPETAYAVLAYGLTYKVMNNRDIISQREFDELCKIKSYGLTLQENMYDEGSELFEQTRNSFAIWPSDVFENYDKSIPRDGSTFTKPNSKTILQIGIHSRGCGDTEVNAKYYLDDEVTKKGLVEVPEKPKRIDVAPKPADPIEYEAWLTVLGLTDGKVNKTKYESYLALNADSLAKYEAYPDLYSQYQADSTAYQEAVNKNIAHLATADVLSRRKQHIAKLILDEEALEGAFEGTRFYDIMRYQMQNKQYNASTITLPAYIAEKYPTFNGATPWVDNMTGKPWYLTLPKR